MRINITVLNDAYLIYDNFILDYDVTLYDSVDVTLGYDYAQKLVTVSYGEKSYNFDLTCLNGDTSIPNANLDKLPQSAVKLSHMTTYGGMIVKSINGFSLATEPVLPKTPNLEDNLFDNAQTSSEAVVSYVNKGALLSNGNAASGAAVNGFAHPDYTFENNLDFSFSFADLQPAQAASAKQMYLVVVDGTDSSKQVVINLFAYCTSDDEATAVYVLHANISFAGQHVAQSNNLLWDVKNFEDYSINIKYDAVKQTVVFTSKEGKKVFDLTKNTVGESNDLAAFPTSNLTFYSIVTNGGIYVESLNDHQFKLNRSEYVVEYTDNQDFFDIEESTAYIGYRNAGIYVSNNAKTSKDYASAVNSGTYTFENYMLFEYKFDCLQTYVASDPYSVMKGIWFNIYDAEDSSKSIKFYPFLYKSGNNYILHLNTVINGTITYENYFIGYDYSNYENVTMYLKYDPIAQTVTLGSSIQTITLDLNKAFNGTVARPNPDLSNIPVHNLTADFDVQFGGMYLQRINNYSFVNPDPTAVDPIDAEITSLDLPTSTLNSELIFTPKIQYNDYPEASLSVSYRLAGEENYVALTSEDGNYHVSFEEYGAYQFKFAFTFDNRTTVLNREVLFQNPQINGLAGLFTTSNGTLQIVNEGISFTNNNLEANITAHAYSMFDIGGVTEVEFKMNSLQSPLTTATFKETWFDFTDGVNGIWVKVFAFNHPDTAGNYNAYCSILAVPNNDKGSALIIRENVQLGFNFNSGNVVDPNLTVRVKYDPYAKTVTVAKNQESGSSFNLGSHTLPEVNYKLNMTVNYGASTLLRINNFSLYNTDGEITFPAPVVFTDGIPVVYTVGDTLSIPATGLCYDLFDLKPTYTVELKDNAQNVIELTLENGYYSANLNQTGSYTLNFTSQNSRELSSQKSLSITVINEDLLPPVIEFAQNAFDFLTKTDRENRYEMPQNTEITLPTPTLSDDSGLDVALTYTVLDPDASEITATGGKFTLTKLGTYRIEYKATDISGKITTYSFSVVSKLVKEEEEPAPAGGCGANNSAGYIGLIMTMLAGAAVMLHLKRKNQTAK